MLEFLELRNESLPLLFSGLVAVFGAIVGSFLNVCILRIPEGRSIIFPKSACACGQPIPFYHNLPIFSWFLLKGRAHCCGQRFSIRYPLIECLTAFLFCWLWSIYPPAVAIIGMLFVAFLICATFIDLDHMIIPDRFSIGGMLLGVLVSFIFPQLHGIEGPPILSNIQSGTIAITGALVGAGLLYWTAVLSELVFRKPAMGEGDIKFVGFIGAFCGWQGALFAMFGGALIGSFVLFPAMLLQKLSAVTRSVEMNSEDGQDKPFAQLGTPVPFGPMLALAGLVYFLGLQHYIDNYFCQVYELFF